MAVAVVTVLAVVTVVIVVAVVLTQVGYGPGTHLVCLSALIYQNKIELLAEE